MPANGQSQKKKMATSLLLIPAMNLFHLIGIMYFFELDFQITETTDNTNYAAENAVAVVNGAFPLINQLKVDFNGANVLDTPGINHAFNVKNLTEFSKDYNERGGPCLFTMWIQLSMLILLTIQWDELNTFAMMQMMLWSSWCCSWC